MVNYELIIKQILNKYVYRTIYLLSVFPVDNTIRVLILYRNITNICHKLIIYSDWTHLININFVTYMVLLYIMIVLIICIHSINE